MTVLALLLAVPVNGIAAPLELEAVLKQVTSANAELLERRAMSDAAAERVAPSGAWTSPMIEVGVVNVPTSGGFNKDPMTMKMVGITQRVPLFGANGLSHHAAEEAVNAERASLGAERLEVLARAYERYAEVRWISELAHETEHHVGTMDRMVAAARTRYESGRGRLDEALMAEAERAHLMAEQAGYESEWTRACAELDVLRGVAPAGRYAVATVEEPVIGPDPEPFRLATLDHPALEEPQARRRSAEYMARAERRRIWPELELNASYGFRETLENPAHGLVTEQDDMFSATVGFMLPLFAGGNEGAKAREQDAMARAAVAGRQRTEQMLAEEVLMAHAEARAAGRMVGLIADTVVVARRRALEAAWNAYGAGSLDLREILDASHRLYEANVALTRARMDRARAVARLIARTGRGDLLGIALPEERSEP